MKIKIIIHVLLLCSFSLLQSMELMIKNDIPITDENLQKLVNGINNSSLTIVNFIKKQAKDNHVPLSPYTIKPFLSINQQQIDTLFLNNIDDDQFRSFLLSMGANINAQTEDKRNCLWFTKRADLLTQLIQQGAEVNALDKYNTTRLHNLLYRLNSSTLHENNEHIEAARALLEGGADPNIISNGDCLLSRIIQHSKPDITVAATKLLCKYHANPNIEDPLEPPLIRAIKTEIFDLVELLLLKGANPNAPNKIGEHPLHVAMQQLKNPNYPSTMIDAIVLILLKYHANPNIPYQIHPYNMPLHVAVLRSQPDIIEELIYRGAETYHRDENGHTAYDLALSGHYLHQLPKKIVDLLKPDQITAIKSSTKNYVPINDSLKQTASQSKLEINKKPDNCILQ